MSLDVSFVNHYVQLFVYSGKKVHVVCTAFTSLYPYFSISLLLYILTSLYPYFSISLLLYILTSLYPYFSISLLLYILTSLYPLSLTEQSV